MILPPEIHPHKTKIQFQDDSAAANSSAANKKKKAETGFIPVSAFLFLCSSKQTVLLSS